MAPRKVYMRLHIRITSPICVDAIYQSIWHQITNNKYNHVCNMLKFMNEAVFWTFLSDPPLLIVYFRQGASSFWFVSRLWLPCEKNGQFCLLASLNLCCLVQNSPWILVVVISRRESQPLVMKNDLCQGSWEGLQLQYCLLYSRPLSLM